MAESVSRPSLSTVIPQDFLVEALGGPANPTALLDRFPDALYNKSPESHLVRFMYAVLGPSGLGFLARNYLEARLRLEELGVDLFDLDSFFGDPFSFGRILEEQYDLDLGDPILNAEQEAIQAKDAAYRSRALDFVGGARLGTTPEGMRLVAKAGLGHDVEIIENYRFLYDIHSDDPKGLPYFGSTLSTEEMIVVPRRDVSQSEVQQIAIYGTPTGGYITPLFNGRTADNPAFRNIAYNAPARSTYDLTDPTNPVMLAPYGVQEILEAHPDIGRGNVRVTGGPGPDAPWIVQFIGNLASRDVPELSIYGDPNENLTGGDPQRTAKVTTILGGVDASEEVVNIEPRDQYALQQALDRLRSVTTIPTVSSGSGRRSPQPVRSAYATSEFTQVVRFVTGNPAVKWPAVSGPYWIEANVEKQAPRSFGLGKQHYQGFHDIANVASYDESGATNQHIGRFHPDQLALFPVLSNTDSDVIFSADRALADHPEQPIVTLTDATGTAYIKDVYPSQYANLTGVPLVKYKDEQFWASMERTEGTDYLEIDLGSVQVVNFVGFETLRKPVDITIDYDHLDHPTRRKFAPVMPVGTFPDSLNYGPDAGWTYLEFDFSDVTGEPIYTRYLRIALTRRVTSTPFILDPVTQTASPWSVEVRNLRIGRNVV